MDKFRERESVLLGIFSQPSLSSPKSPNNNSDMDFSDVFGGPPRRFSTQEVRMRYSFCENVDSEEDVSLSDGRWSGLDEKPVFGSEGMNKKMSHGNDFFDDIFGGDDSITRPYNSPMRSSLDPFGSSPGSRVLSPARPLPPKAEQVSSSFPAPFSLPAKLTKGLEFLGSANRSIFKSKDGFSNGTNSPSPHTSTVSLSRFSSQSKDSLDEIRNDRPMNSETFASHETSHDSEEPYHKPESDGGEKRNALQKDSERLETPRNSAQFHFSIYKWAGSGVPMLTPLIGSNKLRSKGRKKLDKCSSSNGRIENERHDSKVEKIEEYIVSVDGVSDSLKVNIDEPEESGKVIQNQSHDFVHEQHSQVPESKNIQTDEHTIPHDHSTQKSERSQRKNEVDSRDKIAKPMYKDKKSTLKPDAKPLHVLFSNEKEGKGIPLEGERTAISKPNVSKKNSNASASVKEKNTNRISPSRSEVKDVSSQRLATNHGDAPVKMGARRKVKEFVKIFNHETSAKPKKTSDIHSQSCRWEGVGVNGNENKTSNITKTQDDVCLPNKQTLSDASFKDGQHSTNVKSEQDQQSQSSDRKTSGLFADQKNDTIFFDSIYDNVEVKFEDKDEPFLEQFLVEELSPVVDKELHSTRDSIDIKALDAKIQQWSFGRKGNIRSLLSTLQFVLWERSGWKPIPLVDLIEGSAVKRAYQKALLRLHPDKLQQKGAASYQKYTAEKVFDILQEAWDHFNSLGAI